MIFYIHLFSAHQSYEPDMGPQKAPETVAIQDSGKLTHFLFPLSQSTGMALQLIKKKPIQSLD